MPRQLRIEYPGALYHCMARGNRREPIVMDDEDRDRFATMLGEAVRQTGWEFFAWVLMTNHYHLVFKTPEPNLVAGMKWIQNTWTKRYNARHRLWGRLFGDRYKSVLVEGNDHLSCLIDYVHLNPFRAGMVSVERGLESYRWCSLPDYLKPPRKRSGWLQADRGLAQKLLTPDTAANRRRYLRHLEEIALQADGIPAQPEQGERSLHSTLRRGWCFGAEGFREDLLRRLEELKGKAGRRHSRRSGYTGEEVRDHAEAQAARLLKTGLQLAGLEIKQLGGLLKNDWRKRSVGRAIRRNTTVPAAWIAERLHMGNPVRAAALVSRDPEKSWGAQWKEARQLLGRLEAAYENID